MDHTVCLIPLGVPSGVGVYLGVWGLFALYIERLTAFCATGPVLGID